MGLNARWQCGVQTVKADTAVHVYLSAIISRLTKSQPKKACGPWLIGDAATQSITGSAGTSMGDVPSYRWVVEKIVMPSVAQHDSSKGLLGSVQSTLGWSFSCEPGTGDDVTKETSRRGVHRYSF